MNIINYPFNLVYFSKHENKDNQSKIEKFISFVLKSRYFFKDQSDLPTIAQFGLKKFKHELKNPAFKLYRQLLETVICNKEKLSLILDNPNCILSVKDQQHILALALDDPETISLLTKQYKMDLNAFNEEGQTLLDILIKRNDLKGIRSLLKYGAHPLLTNKDGLNPLHYAAEQGSVEIAKLLIKWGCTPFQKNAHGDTPLSIATKNNHLALVLFFLSRTCLNHPNEEVNDNGDTALHCVVHLVYKKKIGVNEAILIINFLVSHHANLEQPNNDAVTATSLAMLRGINDLYSYLKKLAPRSTYLELHRLICLRFGISPFMNFNNKQIDLSGAHLNLIYNWESKHFPSTFKNIPHCDPDWTEEDTQEVVSTIINTSHYSDLYGKEEILAKVEEEYKSDNLITIEAGSKTHAFSVSAHKNLLVVADRACFSPGLSFYSSTNPQNVLNSLKLIIQLRDSENLSSNSLVRRLKAQGLQPTFYFKRTRQNGETCPFSSFFKLAVESAIFLQFLNKGVSFKDATKKTNAIYKAWVAADKLYIFNKYLEEIPKNDPQREIILSFIYHHLEEKLNSRLENAKSIHPYDLQIYSKIAEEHPQVPHYAAQLNPENRIYRFNS